MTSSSQGSASVPDIQNSVDSAGRGVTGRMLQLCQLVANPHHFTILLALSEKDATAVELQPLVKVTLSNVYRELKALREAGLVETRFVGFKRGPQNVNSLTSVGHHLLDTLRNVAKQVFLGQSPKRSTGGVLVESRQRSGRVKLEWELVLRFLEGELVFQNWRWVHGLIDEGRYVMEEHRLQQLADELGVESTWFQELKTSLKPRQPVKG